MLTFPQFNPIAISLGPLSIHWYGIMYIIAFGGAWALASYRRNMIPNQWSTDQISDLIFYGALGAVVGGRLGSVFFYNFDRVLEDILWVFRVWEGGMSFHGGFLGVLAALYFYSKRIQKSFWETIDFVAPFVPFWFGCRKDWEFYWWRIMGTTH